MGYLTRKEQTKLEKTHRKCREYLGVEIHGHVEDVVASLELQAAGRYLAFIEVEYGWEGDDTLYLEWWEPLTAQEVQQAKSKRKQDLALEKLGKERSRQQEEEILEKLAKKLGKKVVDDDS